MNLPFLSDSYFSIGSTHRVCEDYAQHGIFPERDHADDVFSAWGTISDGCSSAAQSDFGAKLLTQFARCYMPYFTNRIWDSSDTEKFGVNVLAKATSAQSTLGLYPESLYATLGTVFASSKTNLTAHLLGDGVIASKTSCGQLSFVHVEYPKEAPFYLQYEADPAAKKAFLGEYGGSYKVTAYFKAEKWEEFSSVEKKIELNKIPFEVWEFDPMSHDFVAVISDGADSVHRTVKTATSKTTEQVPITEVVEELLNFKPLDKPNFNGNFVERRFKRTFRDHPDWQNLDDLSVAVVAKGASNGQETT